MKKLLSFAFITILAVAGYGQTTATEHFKRGVEYSRSGRRAKAEAELTTAIRLDPKHAESYAERGFLRALGGRQSLALSDYSAAIKLNPDLAAAYFGRGWIYQRRSDSSRALADFSNYVRLEPSDAEGFTSRATVYEDLGEYDNAQADYSAALALAPSSAELYYKRGFAYKKGERFELAVADFSKALSFDLADPFFRSEIYIRRCLTHVQAGDKDAALRDANDAIKAAPTSSKAYDARSYVYRLTNMTELAARDERTADRLRSRESRASKRGK